MANGKMGESGYSDMKMSKGYSDMRAPKDKSGVFNLKDNTQASEVKQVPTDSCKYDMGRVQMYSAGSKGYPAEAWNYEF